MTLIMKSRGLKKHSAKRKSSLFLTTWAKSEQVEVSKCICGSSFRVIIITRSKTVLHKRELMYDVLNYEMEEISFNHGL